MRGLLYVTLEMLIPIRHARIACKRWPSARHKLVSAAVGDPTVKRGPLAATLPCGRTAEHLLLILGGQTLGRGLLPK